MTSTPRPPSELNRMELLRELEQAEAAAAFNADRAGQAEGELTRALSRRAEHRDRMEAVAAELAGRFRPSRLQPGESIKFADGSTVRIDTVARTENGRIVIRGMGTGIPYAADPDDCPPHGIPRPESTEEVHIEADTDECVRLIEGTVETMTELTVYEGPAHGGGGTAKRLNPTIGEVLGGGSACTWHIPADGDQMVVHVDKATFTIPVDEVRDAATGLPGPMDGEAVRSVLAVLIENHGEQAIRDAIDIVTAF